MDIRATCSEAQTLLDSSKIEEKDLSIAKINAVIGKIILFIHSPSDAELVQQALGDLKEVCHVLEDSDLSSQITQLSIQAITPLSNEEKITLINQGLSVKLLGLDEDSLINLLKDHGTAVTYLHISTLPVKNLAQILALCPNMQKLSAKKCELKPSDIATINRCSQLEFLDISENANIQLGSSPSSSNLSGLGNLKHLNLSNTGTIQSRLLWISHLTKLEHLDVSHNPLGEGDTKAIARLPNLQHLNMRSCSLYMGSIAKLADDDSRLIKITYLNLSKNTVPKDALTEISWRMEKLEELHLQDCHITYELPMFYSRPLAIKKLYIQGNQLLPNDSRISDLRNRGVAVFT